MYKRTKLYSKVEHIAISMTVGSITFKKMDFSPAIVFMKGTKLSTKGIFPVCIYIVTIVSMLGTIENKFVRKDPSLTVLASTVRTLIVAEEKRAKLNVISKKKII